MRLAHPSDTMEIFNTEPGQKYILTGNEAFTRGLYEAGTRFYSTYPGTPVSEIGDLWEILSQNNSNYTYDLALNEAVAFEEAVGAAWMGVRAAVGFKFLGMNLIADALHTVMYSGLNSERKAGLIIICGSDPDITSSTNAEDVRLFSFHSKLPIFEPSNIKECASFVNIAFELSELWQIPVMIYNPSLLNHASGIIDLHSPLPIQDSTERLLYFIKDKTKYINAIHWARKNQLKLNQLISSIQNYQISQVPIHIKPEIKGKRNETLTLMSQKNEALEELPSNLGFITSGIGWSIAEELCERLIKDLPRMRLICTYPLINDVVIDFITKFELDTVIVIEELEPFLELQIKNIIEDADEEILSSIQVIGKQLIPLEGALSTDKIIQAFGIPHLWGSHQIWFKEMENILPKILPEFLEIQSNLPIREPTFCPGCSHRNVFYALRKAIDQYQNDTGIEAVIGGDIGCYSLCNAPPYNTMDWMICMGAGVGIANGVGRFVDPNTQHIVALIGDSTFFHTGIQPIMNLAKNNVPVLVLILDNSFCAMTGDQISPSTPIELGPPHRQVIPIKACLNAMGKFPILELGGYSIKQLITHFVENFSQPGLKFIIITAECAMNKRRRLKMDAEIEIPSMDATSPQTIVQIADFCVQCNECFEKLGCTAIQLIDGKYRIDESRCMREYCLSCIDICPNHAILKTLINPHLKKTELANKKEGSQ